MIHSLPFAPSASWYNSYLSRLRGENNKSVSEEAMIVSHPNRCVIRDISGNRLTLTIPVEGGGRILRNVKDLRRIKLSDHGNWRHVHLGAFDACYGRAPYYPYLINGLKEIYNSPFETLHDFNHAIHRLIMTFLYGETDKSEILKHRNNPIVKERGEELSEEIEPDISLLDPLMNLGRETLIWFTVG